MAAKGPTQIPSVSQSASRPFFVQSVRLNSLHAQQVFERGFDICANAIFSLSVVLRIVGSDEQSRDVEGVVDERLNKMFEDIKAESARLDKLAETNGIEFQGIGYSNPRDVQAHITSPRAIRYIGLIREFDSLITKLDTLWLSGVIPDSNYSSGVYEWKRRLLRLAGGIRQMAGRAMVAARKKEPQAETTEGATDQDDVSIDMVETPESGALKAGPTTERAEHREAVASKPSARRKASEASA